MKITIELTEDNRINFTQDKPMPFATLSLMLFSVMLGFSNSFVAQLPEKYRKIAKEQIYDAINVGASNVLQTFAPEIEARPNLTTDAILAAENKIIAEKTPEQLHKEYDEPTDLEKYIASCSESNTSAECGEAEIPVELSEADEADASVTPEASEPEHSGGDTSIRPVPKMPRQVKIS